VRRDGCRVAMVLGAGAMHPDLRQAGAIPWETRASDASGDVRPDAWVDAFPVRWALQVVPYVEKLVGPEPDVQVPGAAVLPVEVLGPCRQVEGRSAA
jgi:hypothetical protein